MPDFQPADNRGAAFNPPPGFPAQQPAQGVIANMPTRGAFAISETLPLVQEWAHKMHEARNAWEAARIEANESRAEAKRTRANMVVTLRVFGNSETGGIQIKSSVERNEWCDADADVQRTELEADLKQTAQMVAREAYEETARVFDTIRSMMSVEKEDLNREWHKPR